MDLPKLPPVAEDGKLEVTTTYLEMEQAPRHHAISITGPELRVIRCKRATVSFYRYLYETIGSPWLWWQRREMDDEAIAAIIEDEQVELHVLYVDGCPAGLAELDRRRGDDAELANFGLVPAFLGQGIGKWFLSRVIVLAWENPTSRLWVHTTNLDHPRGLMIYQRMGFVGYDERTETLEDPRARGLFAEHE
jgi:GNAT superfamily N-acetyltransferase